MHKLISIQTSTCVGKYPLHISKILSPWFLLLLVLCPVYSSHSFFLVRDSTMLYTGSLACVMIWGLLKAVSWIKEELTSFVFITLGIPFLHCLMLSVLKSVISCISDFLYFVLFKKAISVGRVTLVPVIPSWLETETLQCLLTSFSYIPHFLWLHFILCLRFSNWSSSLKFFFKKTMLIHLFNLFNEFWVQ